MLRRFSILLVACVFGSGQSARPPASALGQAREIAPGVRHYRLTDPSLLDPAAPIVVHALRLDPALVDVTTDLALGDRQGRGTVAGAVRRREAIAGVNAGFFNLANGDPTGPLRIDGSLVSHAPATRGAVAISHRRGRLAVRVDRVALALSLEIQAQGRRSTARVYGVDTAMPLGALMLYTPRYGSHTGTGPSTTEWVLERKAGGQLDPARETAFTVVGRGGGNGAIPPRGMVLAHGGSTPAAPLSSLGIGASVRVIERWMPASGRHIGEWQRADDVVNGAGVLVRNGKPLQEWAAERLAEAFLGRHPRTLVGVDRAGDVWLLTVDGRQPGYSVGMTLREAQRLALSLGLTEALNLDGGGSTTMVVGGEVVNRPSDPIGPRPVSDVLLVLPRPGLPPRARR